MSTTDKRVLLIGLDGVRCDALGLSDTPHIDRLADAGSYLPLEIEVGERTDSGPMWSSILTGLRHHEHGVLDNYARPSHRSVDCFSSLVQSGVLHKPVASATWAPLVARELCGPVINPADTRVFTPGRAARSLCEAEEFDRHVVSVAEDFLADPEVDGGFVHIDLVDAFGHAFGHDEQYRHAIKTVDSMVGQLTDAIQRRADADRWVIAVTSDHGHTDTGGHGGDTEHERSTWLVASSPEFGTDAAHPRDIAASVRRTCT